MCYPQLVAVQFYGCNGRMENKAAENEDFEDLGSAFPRTYSPIDVTEQMFTVCSVQ